MTEVTGQNGGTQSNGTRQNPPLRLRKTSDLGWRSASALR